MLELIKGIRSILETCVEVKPKEKFLVVTDNEVEPIWKSQVAANVISSMGAEVVLAVISPRENAGQEPPASVATAMKCVDVILYISDKYGMVHTNARKEANAAGVRHYQIIEVPIDDLEKGVLLADICLIRDRTESLAQKLSTVKMARVTNPSGTSITMSLAGREGLAVHPLRHTLASLPDYAEAAVAPVEGTSEGIIVADLGIPGWGYIFRKPLHFTVKGGKVISISGGDDQEVDRLRGIAATDENASNIAELGIGTSHILPWAMHGTRRDAARLGTVHIGIGRNNDIGGNTWSQIHTDILIDQATVELDNQCVLSDGVLVI